MGGGGDVKLLMALSIRTLLCCFVTVVSRKRTYKKYLDDPSLPIPKTTRYRLQQSSLSVSSSFPLVSLHVPGGDFQEAEQSSCPDLPICIDENVQTNINDFKSIGSCESTIDQNANDNAETFDEIEPADVVESSGTPLQEGNMELDVSGSENEIGFSTDSESDSNSNFSGSKMSEEVEDSDVNEDSASENENHGSPQKTYAAQENACMAILSLISRHRITTEAAKDIIALLKILCPENDTVQYKCVETVRYTFMTSVKDVLPFFPQTEKIK